MNSLLLATMLFLQGLVITTGSGTITGRILSTEGAPVEGVRVTAMTQKNPVRQKASRFIPASLKQIARAATAWRTFPRAAITSRRDFSPRPTYYPGVSALSAATVVVVADGTTKEDVDFQLKVPAGMRVSGRMSVLPTPRATSAVVTLGSHQATVNPDGTFEFQRVTPGTYTLQNSFGLPALPVIVTDQDVTGLEIGRGAVGVRVRGRIVGFTAPPARPPSLAQIQLVGAGPIIRVQPDTNGAFEFLKVPPGNYTLRVLGANIQPTSLAVADREITNLEIQEPFQSQLSGRVVLEDGSPWTEPGLGIAARGSNTAWSTSINANGTFSRPLPEGEYQIAPY